MLANAIDSQTGFIHVAPLGSKGQCRLTGQELMNFSPLVGWWTFSLVTRGTEWGGGHFSATAVGLRLALAKVYAKVLNHTRRWIC